MITYSFLTVTLIFRLISSQNVTFNNQQITLDIKNCGQRSHFELTAIISNVSSDLWLGLTINSQPNTSNGSNYIYCFRTNKSESIEHNYYDSKTQSYKKFTNEFLGLNSLEVNLIDNVMKCKFTRENFNRNSNYLNINYDTSSLFVSANYGTYNISQVLSINQTSEVKSLDLTLIKDCEQYTTLDNGNIVVRFQNFGPKTLYEATILIGKNLSVDNIWVAVGINFNRKMPNANAVICKRNSTFISVEHYYNDNLEPKYLDPNNKYIGLSSTYVSANDSYITCKFTRENKNSNSKYIYQSGENLYVMVSYGLFKNDTIYGHSLVKESKSIVSFPIQPLNEDYTNLDNDLIQINFKNCGTKTHFYVTANIGSPVSIDNVWLGLGLNLNRKMPGTNVVVCKRSSNFTSVEHYYNDGLSPLYMNESNRFVGLSSMAITVTGNVMTCEFTRDNSNSNSKYFNINSQQLYMSVAYGSLNGETILVHNKVKVTENIVPLPVLYNCKQFTTLDNNQICIEFENMVDRTNFLVKANIGNGVDPKNFWLGVGLNYDRKMPNADVVICKYNQTNTSIEHYYNDGLVPKYLNSSNIYEGLSNQVMIVENNTVVCGFTRDNFNMNPKYINMTNNLYLISGYGFMNNGDIQVHRLIKETKNSVDFPVEQKLLEYNLTLFRNGNVSVYYKNCGQLTHFEVNALIEDGLNIQNVWIGLGFNSEKNISNSNLVVCRLNGSTHSVEHYYFNESNPIYLNDSNKYEGLRSTSVEVQDRLITCIFTRDNSNSNPKYFSINTQQSYLMIAYGESTLTNIKVQEVSNNLVPLPVQEKCDQFLTFNNGKVQVDFKNYGSQTEFIVKAPIESGITSSFLTLVLFNNSVINYVYCLKSDSTQSVAHGHNSTDTFFFDQNDPLLGLTYSAVIDKENILECRFIRQNSNPNPYYIKTDKTFVGVAYGNSDNQTSALSFVTENIIEYPVVSDFNLKSITQGDFKLSWIERVDIIDFIFETKVGSTNNIYSSFAFSYDRIMGDDTVIVCKAYGNYTSVEHGYNSGKFRPNLLSESEPSIGLQDINIDLIDGILTCSFSREKSRPDVVNYFDTRLGSYILFAKGPTDNNGILSYHTNRVSTSTKVNFLAPLKVSTTTATTSKSTTTSKPKTEFSVFNVYNFTYFGMAIEDSTYYSRITFGEVKTNTKRQLANSSDRYIAYAYSSDIQMGNDSVVVCKISNGTGSVEHYYNIEKSQPVLLDPSNPTIGLSEVNVSVIDGQLVCSFVREKYIEGMTQYHDARDKSYLLIAWGDVKNDVIQFHGSNYLVIVEQLSFVPSVFTTTLPSSTPIPITIVNQYVKNEYGLYWKDEGNYISFNFSTNLTNAVKDTTNFYSSFAFSSDRTMGKDDVIVCKIFGSSSLIHSMYNQDKNEPISKDSNNLSYGLSDISVEYINGILTCRFKRIKSTLENSYHYDLSTSNFYYFLFARGSSSSIEKISYHNENKTSSSIAFDFSASAMTQTTSTTKTTTTTKPKSQITATGKLASSIANLEWKSSEYYIDYTFYEGSIPSKFGRQSTNINRYIAFGYSTDNLMGEDCVVVCKLSNGVGTVEHYYNTGKNTPGYLEPDNPTIGLTGASIVVENGQIKCSFTREKFIDGNSKYCDTRKDFNLLLVKGGVSNGIIQYHGNEISQSEGKINFGTNSTFLTKSLDLAKAKAHGILMVIAWMLCVPTGIIIARYYKFLLPGVKLLDVALWFNIHRVVMFLTSIISIISLLVILAQLDWKWVQSNNNATAMAHSIFGIITISFSVFQVVMGLLRPDKDAKFRSLFEIAHRSVGITLFVLSIVSIYLGVCIKKMNLESVGWGLFLGWNIWFVFYVISLEALPYIFPEEKNEKIELEEPNDGDPKTDEPKDDKPEAIDPNKSRVEFIKLGLLGLNIVISIAFGIALMVVIGVAESGKFS